MYLSSESYFGQIKKRSFPENLSKILCDIINVCSESQRTMYTYSDAFVAILRQEAPLAQLVECQTLDRIY